MKAFLIATTMLTLAATAHAQVPPSADAHTITPGSGTLTDAAGNVWTITPSGSIMEGNTYTPGGGGTSALAIVNGTVYGEDSSGRGWFALSGDGQYWASTQAPAGISATTTQGAARSTSTAPVTIATTPPAPCPAGATGGTGAFYVSGGQIIGPDGRPFIARGINIMHGMGDPSLSQMQAVFPGVNFVRLAIYEYDSPSALADEVNALTSAGIVVELEDHNNGAGNAGGTQGVVFTGPALTNELNWYAAIAKSFAGNPYVWFGTNNEPAENPSAAALSTWQGQTYQAIRSAGNNNPIMVEMNCDGQNLCGLGYTASVYASMKNIVWDTHYYNWLSGFSTDQNTITQKLEALMASAQTFTSADGKPAVIIGEYGNSTTGQAIDAGAAEAVAAVLNAGSSGKYGSAAWAWGTGNPGDGLTTPEGTASQQYGQMVQLYIGTSTIAPTKCEMQRQAQVTADAVQIDVVAPTSNDPTTDYSSLIADKQAEIARLKQELATLQGQ